MLRSQEAHDPGQVQNRQGGEVAMQEAEVRMGVRQRGRRQGLARGDGNDMQERGYHKTYEVTCA